MCARVTAVHLQQPTTLVSSSPSNPHSIHEPEGMHQSQEEDGNPRTVIWGTNVSLESLQRGFRDFFENFREDSTEAEPLYKRLMLMVGCMSLIGNCCL